MVGMFPNELGLSLLANAELLTAQLELAHCFYEGKLVEQSIENARYWAFKAADGGNKMAESYYNTISRPTSKEHNT